MKLYYKSRYFYFNQGAGRYTLEYIFGQQRPDYTDVKIDSFYIPEDKYINNNKYLLIVEVDENNTEAIRYDLENFYKPMFNLAELTTEQVAGFVRSNTTCEEVETNKFKVSEEGTDLTGELIPARYLDLN